MDQFGPNAFGETLEPGRVADCYHGLLLRPSTRLQSTSGPRLLLRRPVRRPPKLREAVERAAELVGESEAEHLAITRPRGILSNVEPGLLPEPPRRAVAAPSGRLRRAVERMMGKG